MDTFEAGDITLNRVDEYIWELPKSGAMNVPGRVLASEALLEEISEDLTLEQLQNTAHLPGIQSPVICMPDGHQGYGFPVGGVAATDAKNGCISPGGVGFDINCGIRIVKTNLTSSDIEGKQERLVEDLFANIPSGLGGGGIVDGSMATVEAILDRGLDWAYEKDYAVEADLTHCEDEGVREESDPAAVSEKAKNRGKNQIGSLGSGNHFLEVQRVEDIFSDDVAEAYGLFEDQIVVMIHCGSRGLGHQICTEYVDAIEQTHPEVLKQLPDKELAAAPAGSELARDYYQAMGAAINFAWVNRQLITYQTRRVFERVFRDDWESLGMDLLYDVSHNIAKKETHQVDGDQCECFVHRKGSTRAFPPGHPDVPRTYRDVGQPVIIPGSMGTSSYILRGGERSMELTFGSTAHGAGRLMSRTQAKKDYWGEDVQDELRGQEIYVKAQSGATIAEEAPGVYKDIDEVVRISDELGIGESVARMRPVCNIKG